MRVLQNCPSLKDQILKYINNLTRAYLKLTVRKKIRCLQVNYNSIYLKLYRATLSEIYDSVRKVYYDVLDLCIYQ